MHCLPLCGYPACLRCRRPAGRTRSSASSSHLLLGEHRGQGHHGPLPAGKAARHVELPLEHALVAVLRDIHRIDRVAEELRVGKAAGIGETYLHGVRHEGCHDDAGALELGARGRSTSSSHRPWWRSRQPEAARHRGGGGAHVQDLAVAAADHVGEEELQEPRRRLDVDGDHRQVLLHRALAGEVALSAEAGIVDDDIRPPAVGMAGVKDLLDRIGAGEICCDGHGLHAALLLHLLGLGIELLLAAPHEDEVAALAGMDVLEAEAEPAAGSGDEGCVAERCVLHGVGSFPRAALPGRSFLTVKRLRERGSSQNISVCQPDIRLRHSVPRNLAALMQSGKSAIVY